MNKFGMLHIMEDKWMDKWIGILKVLLENIKGKKFFWFTIIFCGLLAISKYFPKQYKIFIRNLKDTFDKVVMNIIPCIIFFTTIYAIYLLLKHSDKIHRQNYVERELVSKTHESKSKEPFQIRVFENTKNIFFKEKPYRIISIINNTDMELEYVKGQVDFYDEKTRFFSTPFKIEWLKKRYAHLIIHQEFDFGKDIWEEFDFFIFEAKFGQKIINNTRYNGVEYHRLPKNFKAKSKIEKLSPWDLTWIKEQLNWNLGSRIKWYFRIQTVYEKVPTIKTTRNIVINFSRILILTPVVLAISGILIYIYAKFFMMLIEIIILWSEFLFNMIKELLLI